MGREEGALSLSVLVRVYNETRPAFLLPPQLPVPPILLLPRPYILIYRVEKRNIRPAFCCRRTLTYGYIRREKSKCKFSPLLFSNEFFHIKCIFLNVYMCILYIHMYMYMRFLINLLTYFLCF